MRNSLSIRCLTWCLVLLLILGTAAPVFAAPTRPEPIPREAPSTAVAPEGLTGDEWGTIQEQIRRAEYHPAWQAPGGSDPAYRAPNRAQDFSVAFAPEGFTATGDDWHFGLNLAAYGGTPMPAAIARQNLAAEGATVTYRWTDAVSEWYVNRAEGAKHGLGLHLLYSEVLKTRGIHSCNTLLSTYGGPWTHANNAQLSNL